MGEARTIAGRYLLDEQVGKGPLGVVHRASAGGGSGFRRRVAAKQLDPKLAESEAFLDALARNATQLMAFPRVHVEDIVDVVRSDGEAWLIVDWCDGPSLTTWIEAHHERGTPAPFGQLLAISAKVLYALHALHLRAVPIIHGGVTSRSIRLDRSGQPRLTRACVRSALDASKLDTEWAQSTGLRRDAPEAKTSPSADIFAVGMVIYTALAGATDVAYLPDDLKARVLAGKPVDLNLIRDDIPAVVLRTIERALQPDPRERFDSAAAMARSLELILRSLAENSDPPALGKTLDELVPRKKRPVPSVPPRGSGAPPPPPKPPGKKRSVSEPKLGITGQGTDRLDIEELRALRVDDPKG